MNVRSHPAKKECTLFCNDLPQDREEDENVVACVHHEADAAEQLDVTCRGPDVAALDGEGHGDRAAEGSEPEEGEEGDDRPLAVEDSVYTEEEEEGGGGEGDGKVPVERARFTHAALGT